MPPVHRIHAATWTTALLLLATLAWTPSTSAQGEGITVAVLDSGVDDDHSELQGKVSQRVSFVDYTDLPVDLPGGVGDQVDPGLIQKDPDGQGTAVASLIAGDTLGAAPDAAIVDLQVSAQYTQGQLDPASEDAAQEAMDWLLQQADPPDVVVLSFAVAELSDEATRTLREQARGLAEAGVVVVIPAGPFYTALHNSPHVVTVAGVDGGSPQDAAAPETLAKPDLSAQSVGMAVAVPGQTGGGSTTDGRTGTELAAAQVAAVAARMLEARPALPVTALKAILHDATADVEPAGFDARTGFGALEADAAVAAATAWEDPIPLDAEEIDARDTPVPILAAVLALLVVALAARRR